MPGRGALCSLLTDGSCAVAGDCFEEFAADPELQHCFGGQHVAAFAAVVLADRDLLPADADHTVGGNFAGDPLLTGALIRPLRRRARACQGSCVSA